MRDPAETAPIKIWSAVPLPADVRQALRRMSQADDVRRIAVMPDVHLTPAVCNGVAMATRDLIYPQAVGGDIGCGMLAAAFDGDVRPFEESRWADAVLSKFLQRIPENRHSSQTMPTEFPDDLVRLPLSTAQLERGKQRDGRVQLGTLGRGNHFVELQADADDRLWIMIHSGSRGMGQAIASHHLRQAQRHGPGGLVALDSRCDAGRDYLQDADWAVRYAEENRLAMLESAAAILVDVLGYQLDHDSLIHLHHNHVRRETHDAGAVWVHRKGAMPADEGLPGIIPGSMGTRSYHVLGRGCEAALRSCSHGAGRAMSRTISKHRISRDDLFAQMQGVRFDEHRAELFRDEAPAAYKEIRSVMRAQRELTRIVRELRPVLVHKGA